MQRDARKAVSLEDDAVYAIMERFPDLPIERGSSYKGGPAIVLNYKYKSAYIGQKAYAEACLILNNGRRLRIEARYKAKPSNLTDMMWRVIRESNNLPTFALYRGPGWRDNVIETFKREAEDNKDFYFGDLDDFHKHLEGYVT